MAPNIPEKMELVYDDQCPVCRTYCKALPQRDDLKLVDARQEGETMRDINRLGLDIDEGMVLKADGKIFYGSDAVHELTLRFPQRGWTGWMNRLFFRNRRSAHIFYPAAKAVRNALLRLLGIEKINNLKRPK